MTEPRWRWVLLTLGGSYLALAGWAAAHPPSFRAVLANFGAPNPHLVRDFAACAATFGLGLVIAHRAPGWRTPALALAAVWNGLHALGHLHDIAEARPAFVGPVEAVALLAATALLAWLTLLSRRAAPDDGGDR